MVPVKKFCDLFQQAPYDQWFKEFLVSWNIKFELTEKWVGSSKSYYETTVNTFKVGDDSFKFRMTYLRGDGSLGLEVSKNGEWFKMVGQTNPIVAYAYALYKGIVCDSDVFDDGEENFGYFCNELEPFDRDAVIELLKESEFFKME
eukprot:TRINITY_DN2935_c0_g1_i1.p1 TRINITY_DN2935_c0_g1~~TRINITY_DN2935_c0_g1_i1.p1  ORF type:complete len:146 (-),score=25.11 TRINITY_DN2935_c0_g1_i1:230-667(-)